MNNNRISEFEETFIKDCEIRTLILICDTHLIKTELVNYFLQNKTTKNITVFYHLDYYTEIEDTKRFIEYNRFQYTFDNNVGFIAFKNDVFNILKFNSNIVIDDAAYFFQKGNNTAILQETLKRSDSKILLIFEKEEEISACKLDQFYIHKIYVNTLKDVEELKLNVLLIDFFKNSQREKKLRDAFIDFKTIFFSNSKFILEYLFFLNSIIFKRVFKKVFSLSEKNKSN